MNDLRMFLLFLVTSVAEDVTLRQVSSARIFGFALLITILPLLLTHLLPCSSPDQAAHRRILCL
jgi:hypothetical protein